MDCLRDFFKYVIIIQVTLSEKKIARKSREPWSSLLVFSYSERKNGKMTHSASFQQGKNALAQC